MKNDDEAKELDYGLVLWSTGIGKDVLNTYNYYFM
jgi:hypothetical protein